jgi:HEAT repeat protein
VVQELPEQSSEHSAEERRDAVDAMRGMRDDACVPLLLKAMEDGSWRVRKTAVGILFDDYPLEKYIGGLIELLSLDDNAGARNSAIEALIRLGRRATGFLVEAFRTPNRDVRKFIIDVLGGQNDDRSLPLMLGALKDEDENVRATAVEHLGKRGELSVVDALIEILDGGDLWTAYPAADALGRIGNVKAVPHLVRALKIKPLREPVLKSLGRLAVPATLEHIIPFLEDPSKGIREQALQTIGRVYHNGVRADVITAEMRRVLGEKAMGVLITHAWSARREVRISAILLLGLMRDEAAYGPLLEISQEAEFADDVKSALIFIGKEKPESLLKLFDTDSTHQLRVICEVAAEVVSPVYYAVFERLLSDSDGHVRSHAAEGIAKLGDARAAPKLMRLLSDTYEDVQEAAVRALSKLGGALDTEELIKMLRSDTPALRRNTACLVGALKASSAVDELGFALKDADAKVRNAVVGALASIGTAEAVKYLKHALTDEEPDVRISAALSLGAIGGEGTIDSLILLAADPDTSVRGAAARALGMLREKGAVKTLAGLLNDRSGFVVTTAVEALGTTGGSDARNAIEGMLSSSDEEIRRTAISSLASFENIERELLPFLDHPDWATRIAAVRALGGRAKGEVRSELERLLDTEEDHTVRKAVEEALRV